MVRACLCYSDSGIESGRITFYNLGPGDSLITGLFFTIFLPFTVSRQPYTIVRSIVHMKTMIKQTHRPVISGEVYQNT